MGVNALIPTRFLLLIAHTVLTIVLLWSNENNVKSCLPETYTETEFNSRTTSLTAGLAMTLVFLLLEYIGFMGGFTMFMPSQDLLSIAAHASASISLAFFIFDDWPCDYFWWMFGFCSVLPGVTEAVAILSFVLNWNL